MQIVERTAKSDVGYADEVLARGRGLFQSKELRDRVANIIKLKGFQPTRRIVVGQQLHPEYVTDYVGTLEIGFGNCQYQTYWSKLYEVSVR